MANTLNISLPDELHAFVKAQCDGTGLYSTPSEFVRDLIRQQARKPEPTQAKDFDGIPTWYEAENRPYTEEEMGIRRGVLQGYKDIAAGDYETVSCREIADQVLEEMGA